MTRKPRASPGRPRDPLKHAAILSAARQLFLLQGYDNTSMDAVASAAGVSKLTIYNHFSDKESLFYATIEATCPEDSLPAPCPCHELSLEELLTGLGCHFFHLINRPEAIGLYRLMISKSRTRPELSARLYQNISTQVIQQLAATMESLHGHGKLNITDPLRAAEHFFSLIRGNHTLRLLIDTQSEMPEEQIEQHIRDAVQLFIRGYSMSPPR